MRGLVILASFMATLVHAAMNDYVEVRDLVLPADGIERLNIDAGAGRMVVTGDAASSEIRVSASIEIDTGNEEKAREMIEKDLVLTLDREGGEALLESRFRDRFFNWGKNGVVHLDVTVPQHLELVVDDGSGSIEIAGVGGYVRIDDGSGSMVLRELGGNVDVDDGSGSIDIRGVIGDLDVEDGSGSISIESVSGSVRIDDGSGGITVKDVGQDLVIVDAGSGSVRFSGIGGTVDYDED